MLRFPDVYIQVIYDYICKHDGDMILYKDIMDKYQMSYPTVAKKIKWLIQNKLITKQGRRITTIPQF